MTMYDELVNSLRICGKIRSADDYCVAFHDGCCEAEPVCMYELMMKAADAIEELSKRTVKGNCKSCARSSTVLNNNTTRCPLEEHYALPDDGYCHLYEPPAEE